MLKYLDPAGLVVGQAPSASSYVKAWHVGFEYGYSGYNGKDIFSPVRLVRTGQPSAFFDLSISFSGTGSGAVNFNPPNTNHTSNYSESYTLGTMVTLSASADSLSSFVGWTGCTSTSSNRCTVEMTSDKMVTANFAKPLDVNDNFQRPVGTGYTISNAFGEPYEPYGFHSGIDYQNTSDINVYAAAHGTVVTIQPNGQCSMGCLGPDCGCADRGFGNTLILEHRLVDGQKVYSQYSHLDFFASGLKVGDCVKAGIPIGVIGASAYGIKDYYLSVIGHNNPHLHFELKKSNTLLNPVGDTEYFAYLPQDPQEFGYIDPYLFIINPANQVVRRCTNSAIIAIISSLLLL